MNNPSCCPRCKSRRWNKEHVVEEIPVEEEIPDHSGFCPECNSLLSGRHNWKCSNPKCKEYEPIRDVVSRQDDSHTKLTVVNKFCIGKCGELSDELTDILLDHLKATEKEHTVGSLTILTFPLVTNLIKRDIASRGIPWDEQKQRKRVNATISNIMKRVVKWLDDTGQEPVTVSGGRRYKFDEDYYFSIFPSSEGHRYLMEKIKNTEVEN